MEEVKKAIAFLFKRKGREAMSEKDFVMSASMDLGWFPPKEAQRLMQIGLDSKLLLVVDGKLKLSFDAAGMDIPLDYKPPPALLQAGVAPPSIFVKVLERITAATKLERKQVVSMINSIQDMMDVEAEVAALIVGRDLGVDVSDLLDGAEREIMSRSG
jgi:hypothetical protein